MILAIKGWLIAIVLMINAFAMVWAASFAWACGAHGFSYGFISLSASMFLLLVFL